MHIERAVQLLWAFEILAHQMHSTTSFAAKLQGQLHIVPLTHLSRTGAVFAWATLAKDHQSPKPGLPIYQWFQGHALSTHLVVWVMDCAFSKLIVVHVQHSGLT